MKNNEIKICPNCGSIDIQSVPSVLEAVGVPPTFKCKKCLYEGQLFPEIEEHDINKFQKDIKEK